MLFFAILLNLFSSYFVGAIFNNIVIIFITFFALVVLNLEILSLFNGIKPFNILFLEVFFLIISFLFFKKENYPKITLNFDFKRLKNSLKLDKSLLILSFAFIFFLVVELFLATILPAFEADSQTYHFFRSYMFIKQNSLNHFETNDIRALIMPINSEIIYSWILAFKKNFYGFGLVSFFSYLLFLINGWQIAEKFKISYRKRLFFLLIFSSFANVIIQISSLQTDLLVGSLLITSLNLFLTNKKSKIYFSSLAFALALGVKTTAIIALLAIFILYFLIEFFIDKNKKLDKLKHFSLCLVINFFVFSSYNYILNFVQFHNFFSNNSSYLAHRFWGGVQGYIANIIHFSFQSLDFTGFRWGEYLNNPIMTAKSAIFNFLNINPKIGTNVPIYRVNTIAEEQICGFGVLGFLAFIPALIKSVFLKIKFKNNKKITFFFFLTFTFLAYFLLLARSVGYMIYSIRFLISFVALSSMVLTLLYLKKTIYKKIIVVFCLFYLLLISTHIRKAPLNIVLSKFNQKNYTLTDFEKDCYLGRIYLKTPYINEIYFTILNKYKDKKNIALIKSTKSVVFYLKSLEYQGYRVDFLNSALINYDKLKKYDLVIVENSSQDDDVFNIEDVKINYSISNNSVVFKDDNSLNCYYIDIKQNVTNKAKNAVKRNCFSYNYLSKDKDLKLDYVQEFFIKELNQNNKIYYFIKN